MWNWLQGKGNGVDDDASCGCITGFDPVDVAAAEVMLRSDKNDKGDGGSDDMWSIGDGAEVDVLATRREVFAWYGYDAANSVFAASGLGAFLPLLANDLAKQAAGDDCKVHFGAVALSPASFAATFISFSVLFQAIAFVCTGAMADFGQQRRRLLFFTAILGSLFNISFIFFYDPTLWWLCGVWIVLTNLIYGMSLVFYNSYLPILVRSTPRFILTPSKDKHSAYLRLSNKMSQWGFIWGYISSVIILIIAIPIVIFLSQDLYPVCPATNATTPTTTTVPSTPTTPSFVPSVANNNFSCVLNVSSHPYNLQCVDIATEYDQDNILSYRVILALTGGWWLIFSVLSIPRLEPRPGPPLPSPKRGYLLTSLCRVGHSLQYLKELPQLGLFMLLYFVASDTYSTIGAVGVLFLNDELNVSSLVISVLLLEVPLCAGLGVFIQGRIQKRWGIHSKTMCIANMVGLFLLCSYVGLGLIDSVPIGLREGQDYEILIWGGLYGALFGPVQSYFRCLYSGMIPLGHEGEFFALFEISDKGSSWMGPLISAAIKESSGTFRWAVVYLGFMCMLSLPLLWLLNPMKGVKQAYRFLLKKGEMSKDTVVTMNDKPMLAQAIIDQSSSSSNSPTLSMGGMEVKIDDGGDGGDGGDEISSVDSNRSSMSSKSISSQRNSSRASSTSSSSSSNYSSRKSSNSYDSSDSTGDSSSDTDVNSSKKDV